MQENVICNRAKGQDPTDRHLVVSRCGDCLKRVVIALEHIELYPVCVECAAVYLPGGDAYYPDGYRFVG